MAVLKPALPVSNDLHRGEEFMLIPLSGGSNPSGNHSMGAEEHEPVQDSEDATDVLDESQAKPHARDELQTREAYLQKGEELIRSLL